jgi:hypothetical protein
MSALALTFCFFVKSKNLYSGEINFSIRLKIIFGTLDKSWNHREDRTISKHPYCPFYQHRSWEIVGVSAERGESGEIYKEICATANRGKKTNKGKKRSDSPCVWTVEAHCELLFYNSSVCYLVSICQNCNITKFAYTEYQTAQSQGPVWRYFSSSAILS